MNLDDEAISIIITLKLYLAMFAEAMLWTEKYPFLSTNYEFKLLENSKWIFLGSCYFEATMGTAKTLDAQHWKNKSCLNPWQFKPTNTSSNQQQYITPGQKKTKDAIDDNNLAWIEGNNYHEKNMNMTKFFHDNE